MSLRDVERAMIVFEFFYEKMQDVFTQLINERANKEYLDELCQVCEISFILFQFCYIIQVCEQFTDY